MENACFMLQELSKLSKLEKSQTRLTVNSSDVSALDQAIKETRLVFTKAFKAYCNEQYNYMFKNLIEQEGKSKNAEETTKIYNKFFQKKEYAHASLTRMMKRVKKHLQT